MTSSGLLLFADSSGYVPAALVRVEVTLLKMVLISVAIFGTTATAATATKPTISAYSTKSCPCVSCHKFLQNVFIEITPFPTYSNIGLVELKSVILLTPPAIVTDLRLTFDGVWM